MAVSRAYVAGAGKAGSESSGSNRVCDFFPLYIRRSTC